MISCNSHDYVEIACMYGIEVRLTYKGGQVIQGKAFQTTYNDSREECILLKTAQGNKEIVLDQIVSMEAVTKNTLFTKIDFV